MTHDVLARRRPETNGGAVIRDEVFERKSKTASELIIREEAQRYFVGPAGGD
jgi:hypothetical protein